METSEDMDAESNNQTSEPKCNESGKEASESVTSSQENEEGKTEVSERSELVIASVSTLCSHTSPKTSDETPVTVNEERSTTEEESVLPTTNSSSNEVSSSYENPVDEPLKSPKSSMVQDEQKDTAVNVVAACSQEAQPLEVEESALTSLSLCNNTDPDSQAEEREKINSMSSVSNKNNSEEKENGLNTAISNNQFHKHDGEVTKETIFQTPCSDVLDEVPEDSCSETVPHESQKFTKAVEISPNENPDDIASEKITAIAVIAEHDQKAIESEAVCNSEARNEKEEASCRSHEVFDSTEQLLDDTHTNKSPVELSASDGESTEKCIGEDQLRQKGDKARGSPLHDPTVELKINCVQSLVDKDVIQLSTDCIENETTIDVKNEGCDEVKSNVTLVDSQYNISEKEDKVIGVRADLLITKSANNCDSESVSSDICEADRSSNEVIKNSEVVSEHQGNNEIVNVHDKSEKEASVNSESEAALVSQQKTVEKCNSGKDGTIKLSVNAVPVCSTSNDRNEDKDIQTMASADVDNVCNEDTVENPSHIEEEDPFFSCNDKNKDSDILIASDDQERESISPMDVDHIDEDSQEKSGRSKTPSDAAGKDNCLVADDTVNTTDDLAIREDETSSLIQDTDDKDTSATEHSNELPSSTDEMTSVCGDTTNASEDVAVVDEETITADKSSTGDEELCIVPDTAPRVPTDKEKADAVEKASKASCSSKNDVQSEALKKPEDLETDKGDQSASDVADSTFPPEGSLYSELASDTNDSLRSESEEIPKVARTSLIHVISTASLLHKSQLEDAEKEDSAADKNSSESTEEQTCCQCNKVLKCKYKLKEKENTYLCEDKCYTLFRKLNNSESSSTVVRGRKIVRPFLHKCGQCKQEVDTSGDKFLTWETMDFCNDDCLEKYQRDLGAHCANCKGPVQSSSLGKYCVRFGYDMKQFCLASCLEDFKKGLKVCSYCQKDISAGCEGFLAPVGDKGQFKDFCSQICMEKYDQMSNNTAPPETIHECAVCYNVKVVKVEVVIDSKVQKLCSEPCFAAFKFVNGIVAGQCDMCKKYFDKDKTDNFSVFYDDAPHSFCCKTCMNVYILAKRKIVPCTWCKVKKYNFDMIKRVLSSGQVLMMCSLHCMNLYHVSVSAVSTKKTKCDKCNLTNQSQYHLTMSDATIRNFCSYSCVMSFQSQYSKPPIPVPDTDKSPHPLGNPRRINARRCTPVTEKETSKASAMPVISSVTSLATSNGQSAAKVPPLALNNAKPVTNEAVKTLVKQQIIIKPPPPPDRQNRAIQVRPIMSTKGITCRPHASAKETQTDDAPNTPKLIPIPVPIFIPAPMHMYSSPYPVPVPFLIPIPVPIFIPTTKNSAKGILEEIKKIQEKVPSDPFEAEMLMMAEMVANEKKVDNADTESEEDNNAADCEPATVAEPEFSPEAVDTSNTFGEDMLQMALKIASELDEPAVDFEAAVAPSTITQHASQHDQGTDQNNDATESENDDSESEAKPQSGRKRVLRSSSKSNNLPSKRGRKSSGSDHSNLGSSGPSSSELQNPVSGESKEKPDANRCLKFTFGVNAWKHWVTQKNAELEQAAGNNRKLKLFKTELLQLTADELNYSLCLFVKEVRKPNGSEYAPDTIYYLCLGIQQYLIENGRVENIFTDTYYEKFTECLDEVAKKFTYLHKDSHYVVTRVEEEHLWESKQLGAISPYVLLCTLMFFNTKYFNLTTVEEHMQISFSHIMKHWKKQPSQSNSKMTGSRNLVLRFYPPQTTLVGNPKKKKMYEQDENEENPLRCPVKLYEFYLSKCPESVKTRNDVFYLLPERSCVPDSPVWYSTMTLGHGHLQKMLHRIKMVKEINVALLNG